MYNCFIYFLNKKNKKNFLKNNLKFKKIKKNFKKKKKWKENN